MCWHMKTNTSAMSVNLNPARHMMRAWIGRVIAWFQYPEVQTGDFKKWCEGQILEDQHTAKLLITGIIVVHLGLAFVLLLTKL